MTPTTPPSGPAPSQRTLAAIVFTDVVGFSARMQTDEVGTIKLLERDFAEMRRICTEHEGAVLKTTGDGLLLTFTSAVQAVACALAMQRQFAAEAKGLDPSGPLQHRIGIHLGDVLVQNQDVMGDGVNIASRLQAEAEPGGICISQTVYDVVKNKLKMQVVSLGPRELKNISQAIPVYRLLLEAQTRNPFSRTTISGASKPLSPRRRKLFLALGGVAVLALVFVAGTILSRRAAQQQVQAVDAAKPPGPVAATPAPVPPTPAATKGTDENDSAANLASRKEAFQQLRTQYLDKYDFVGLVRALREKGEGPNARPGAQLMLRSAEQLLTLKEWLDFTLRRYNKQHPLIVHDLSGNAAKDTQVFLAADLRVVFLVNGQPQQHDWAELKPGVVGAIIVSTMHEVKQLPRDVTVGAQTFAKFYGLPAMTEALGPPKARHEK